MFQILSLLSLIVCDLPVTWNNKRRTFHTWNELARAISFPRNSKPITVQKKLSIVQHITKHGVNPLLSCYHVIVIRQRVFDNGEYGRQRVLRVVLHDDVDWRLPTDHLCDPARRPLTLHQHVVPLRLPLLAAQELVIRELRGNKGWDLGITQSDKQNAATRAKTDSSLKIAQMSVWTISRPFLLRYFD